VSLALIVVALVLDFQNFSKSWLAVLPPLVKSCAEDVARGALSVGLLQATRERFMALLRGHVSLFLAGLARNFGFEALCRLPRVEGP
jgi:hypothetical protein